VEPPLVFLRSTMTKQATTKRLSSRSQRGASFFEYVLLVAMIACFSISALDILREEISAPLEAVACELELSSNGGVIPFTNRSGGICGTQNTKGSTKQK
jgi:hypothetical protein